MIIIALPPFAKIRKFEWQIKSAYKFWRISLLDPDVTVSDHRYLQTLLPHQSESCITVLSINTDIAPAHTTLVGGVMSATTLNAIKRVLKHANHNPVIESLLVENNCRDCRL